MKSILWMNLFVGMVHGTELTCSAVKSAYEAAQCCENTSGVITNICPQNTMIIRIYHSLTNTTSGLAHIASESDATAINILDTKTMGLNLTTFTHKYHAIAERSWYHETITASSFQGHRDLLANALNAGLSIDRTKYPKLPDGFDKIEEVTIFSSDSVATKSYYESTASFPSFDHLSPIDQGAYLSLVGGASAVNTWTYPDWVHYVANFGTKPARFVYVDI